MGVPSNRQPSRLVHKLNLATRRADNDKSREVGRRPQNNHFLDNCTSQHHDGHRGYDITVAYKASTCSPPAAAATRQCGAQMPQAHSGRRRPSIHPSPVSPSCAVPITDAMSLKRQLEKPRTYIFALGIGLQCFDNDLVSRVHAKKGIKVQTHGRQNIN